MLENLAKHVDLIAQTIEVPESWREVLATVVKDCGLNSAMFFIESNDNPGDALALYNVGLSDEAIEAYYETYFKKSIILNKVYESQRGRFWNITDFSEDYFNTPIYKNWCVPNNIFNVVACLIDVPGNVTLRLHFHSDPDQGKITDEQKQYLDYLVPHIQRAIDYHQQWSLAKAYYKAATFFIECYPMAAILLDANQELVYINTVARKLCADNPLLKLNGKKLFLQKTEQEKDFQDLLTHCITESEEQFHANTLVVKNKKGDAAIEFNLLPFGTEEFRFGREFHRPLVMVRMRDIRSMPVVNGEALAILFGLTEKEKGVALFLASGLTLEQIANETSTSLNTVRTHLRALFRKTGCNSQQQLVIKLLSAIS